MQKKIELLERTSGASLFAIDDFSFRLTETDRGKMIKYSMEMKMETGSPLDVRFLLEEIDPELEFILESPVELTDYIKEFEENKNPDDESLFHDMRTKYVEFIKTDASEVAERVIILGFSIVEGKLYMVVKTFSLNLLSSFLDKLQKYCSENEIEFEVSENIRWIELKQYAAKQKEAIRGRQREEFLEKTLVKSHFPRFIKIFRKIDKDGYFKKKFYNEIMFQEKRIPDGTMISVPIGQISRFFSAYWKYTISASDKEVLCLHDEKPSDEKMEEYVYTFKPNMMGYYLRNWFEDFTVEIIKRTSFLPYTVTHIMPGNDFDFFLDGRKNHIREIDVVVSVEIHGSSKLMAIECKKTISDKEIQSTNKKSRERVLDSGKNVFDAFIHVGCFSNEVIFEKTFQGTKLNYKQGIISSSDGKLDVPFYAFDISSIEDYEQKLMHVIKDVFENW